MQTGRVLSSSQTLKRSQEEECVRNEKKKASRKATHTMITVASTSSVEHSTKQLPTKNHPGGNTSAKNKMAVHHENQKVGGSNNSNAATK